MAAKAQRIDASGQIGSGPIVVYGFNPVSAAAEADIILHDGTSTAGVSVIQQRGEQAGQGTLIDLEKSGVMFPNGCYAELDADTSALAVYYEKLGTHQPTKPISYQVIADPTTPTYVHSTGRAVILYGINITGSGVGQVITVQNGASENVFQLNLVAAGDFRTDVFGRGVIFPLGCLISGSEAATITALYSLV